MSSDFFQACLSSGMVEAQKNEVTLPDDVSLQFDVIVRFMYTGCLGYLKTSGDKADAQKGLKGKEDILSHALADVLRLYRTAAKYGMSELQNCIADRLCDYLEWNAIDPSAFLWAHSKMGEASPLTRILEDDLVCILKEYPWLYNPEHKDIEDDKQRGGARKFEAKLREVFVNTNFLVSGLQKLVDGRQCILSVGEKAMDDPCLYHVHRLGDICVKEVDRSLRYAPWGTS